MSLGINNMITVCRELRKCYPCFTEEGTGVHGGSTEGNCSHHQPSILVRREAGAAWDAGREVGEQGREHLGGRVGDGRCFGQITHLAEE